MKTTFITAKKQLIIWCCMFLGSTYAQLVPDQSLVMKAQSKAAVRRNIAVADLSLHKYLVVVLSNIGSILEESLASQSHDAQEQQAILEHNQDLSFAANLATEALVLLGQIIDDFNEQSLSYNAEIEYRFLKMCNGLRGVDFQAVEPYRLREQYELIKNFDQMLKIYCINRKSLLSQEDLNLFNKITKFNHMLMLQDVNGNNILLHESYFDIGYFDTIADYLVYRPWEFASQHPYVTAAVGVGIITTIGYFYVYPWLMREDPYENNNQEYNVRQDHGLKQGLSDCGYYSLLHALMRRNAKNDDEFNAMVQRARAQGNLLDAWKANVAQQREDRVAQHIRDGRPAADIAAMQRGDGWAIQEELQNILMNRDLINQVLQPIVGQGNNIAHDNVVVVDAIDQGAAAQRAMLIAQQRAFIRAQLRAGRNPGPIQPVDLDGFAVAGQNAFIDQMHRNNAPQHIVLHLQNAPHWVCASVEPDQNSQHGIRAYLVNSSRPNITNQPAVNRLLQACSVN